MAIRIYILLPVHNRRDITQRFIISLAAQTFRNFHLVLIDDGSTDGTEQMVRSHIGDLTVIRGKGDWWWGGALQQGYLWLKEQGVSVDDVVLIINDDTEIEPDYLATGMEVLACNPKSLLITRCLDRQTGKVVDTGVYRFDFASMTFNEVEDADAGNCCSTRGLFVTAGDMFTIGGFHPVLLPHYLSDVEYTHRGYCKGLRVLSDARLRLYLDEEATGFHKGDYGVSSPLVKVMRHFSKKSSDNPLYWTSFILLSCPWRYKMRNIIRVWAGTAGFLAKPGSANRPGQRS
jgi:GT2 family glycosyltransferase